MKYLQADYTGYANSIAALRERFMQFPRSVSIETQVKCNAKCTFCPYPTSPRQGEEMSDELFYKILDDLQEIPVSHHFGITLHRINEPLLDRRMPEFHAEIARRFPNAWIQFISNGTSIKKGKFEWMANHSRGRLTISLNTIDEQEHENLMGFGLNLVTDNLDNLHQIAKDGKFKLPVLLCAPYCSEVEANSFLQYCTTRWPMFQASVRPVFQWMGGSGAGNDLRYEAPRLHNQSNTPDTLPCGQWFDLHILANGFVSKCCIDETGYSNNDLFDASTNNVLAIFQRQHSLRLNIPARTSVSGCEKCMHLG